MIFLSPLSLPFFSARSILLGGNSNYMIVAADAGDSINLNSSCAADDDDGWCSS